MISHLLRRHAITENSPALTENTDFANSLMNKMVEKVEELIRQRDHFHAQACVHRMFCIGHVLNLAV
jgi:hypothetical protein